MYKNINVLEDPSVIFKVPSEQFNMYLNKLHFYIDLCFNFGNEDHKELAKNLSSKLENAFNTSWICKEDVHYDPDRKVNVVPFITLEAPISLIAKGYHISKLVDAILDHEEFNDIGIEDIVENYQKDYSVNYWDKALDLSPAKRLRLKKASGEIPPVMK